MFFVPYINTINLRTGKKACFDAILHLKVIVDLSSKAQKNCLHITAVFFWLFNLKIKLNQSLVTFTAFARSVLNVS